MQPVQQHMQPLQQLMQPVQQHVQQPMLTRQYSEQLPGHKGLEQLSIIPDEIGRQQGDGGSAIKEPVTEASAFSMEQMYHALENTTEEGTVNVTPHNETSTLATEGLMSEQASSDEEDKPVVTEHVMEEIGVQCNLTPSPPPSPSKATTSTQTGPSLESTSSSGICARETGKKKKRGDSHRKSKKRKKTVSTKKYKALQKSTMEVRVHVFIFEWCITYKHTHTHMHTGIFSTGRATTACNQATCEVYRNGAY